jgi:helicase-like protein
MKWAIIKSCRGVEFKLSLTATPAPNDPIEYASQAAFLEKIRDEGEVIWTYFIRDKEGEWKIKDHALPAFYWFLSGWSCYVRHPSRYGFRDNLKDLKDPERLEYILASTDEQLAAVHQVPDATGQTSLLDPVRLGIVERGRLAQISSGFLYQTEGPALRIASPKPSFIADLIRREVAAGLQVIVWTLYDETVEILREELADASFGMAIVTGSVPTASRPAIVEAFKAGAERVLISRPEVLGFGANLQCAGSVIWADLNDSYEQMYQGDRRAYRYGQTKRVRIHCPRIAGLQDAVWANLQSKAAMFERDVSRMERLYIEAMRDLLPREERAV